METEALVEGIAEPEVSIGPGTPKTQRGYNASPRRET